MIELVGTAHKDRTVFSAQDSYDSLPILVNNGLLSFDIQYFNSAPQLLYSKKINQLMEKIGIQLPFDEIVKFKCKTQVLIGVR